MRNMKRAVRSNNQLQGYTRKYCVGLEIQERGLSVPLEMMDIKFPRDLREVSTIVCW